MRKSIKRLIPFTACAFALLPSSLPAQTAERGAAAAPEKDNGKSSVVTRLMAFDKNGDGKLTKEELTDTRLHRLFDMADMGKTGVVTREQLVALGARVEREAAQNQGPGGPGGPPGGFGRPGGPGGRRGPGEHAAVDLSKLPPVAKASGVTFEKDIKPLFAASCVKCHEGDRPKADLRLDSLDAVLTGSEDGKVVSAGDSKKSSLVIAVAQLDDETAMPPKRGPGGGPGGRPGGGPGGGPRGGPGGPGGDQRGPGGPGGGFGRGPGGPGGLGGGPPPKALTAEQVGLVRAWIDQGAK